MLQVEYPPSLTTCFGEQLKGSCCDEVLAKPAGATGLAVTELFEVELATVDPPPQAVNARLSEIRLTRLSDGLGGVVGKKPFTRMMYVSVFLMVRINSLREARIFVLWSVPMPEVCWKSGLK
jgi:hypothetical protein